MGKRRILAMTVDDMSIVGTDTRAVVRISSLPVEKLINETFIPYPEGRERVATEEEPMRELLARISSETHKTLHLISAS
jgi:hypothetical protein